MRKYLPLAMLLFFMAAEIAVAGQFRIAPPQEHRRRQPPRGYRESRLEIVNEDDRGYAIDVDYRRNRMELRQRSGGDIFVPGNSRIVLTFDDDDDWTFYGDHEALNIEIRSGRTTTLRLETRWHGRQIGLFGTVDGDRRSYSKQLFRYTDRPGRDGPGQHRQPPPPQPQPHRQPQPPHQPPPPPHGQSNSGSSVGRIVGDIVEDLFGKDDHRSGGPGGPRR